MNVAILRGRLSSPPRQQQPASGDVLLSLEVTTRGHDGTAASVPVAWFSRSAAGARWAAGTEVVVVGVVRRRFFRTKGGARASRTEVVATTVALAARPAAVAKALDRVGAALDAIAHPSAAAPAAGGRRDG